MCIRDRTGEAWLHTALVEGCIVSLKPGVKPSDIEKAGFTRGEELGKAVQSRLGRGLGGVTWFTLVGSQGAVHIGRAAARPVCVVVQSKGSSEGTWQVLMDQLEKAKTPKLSSSTGKKIRRDVYSLAAGARDLWITVARTNDFAVGEQGASAVIMVELKKR